MTFDKKKSYVLFSCISLVVMIVGATFAYFTASITDNNTVVGDAATVTFSLGVQKVTSVDMAFGLIPMKNKQAPNAAEQKCLDDLGNAGCQMYKVTVNADSDTVMFLDGYVIIKPRVVELETRFTQIFTEDDGETFRTGFTNDDMGAESFVEDDVIKNGVRNSVDPVLLNHTDDFGCLLVTNEQIGGDVGRSKTFYFMIWVYDNGTAQDYLQGMELAYTGEVTFLTAEGNQISATFD